MYYDSDNWSIKNTTRPYINCASIPSYFSYLYNSNKPQYPLMDTSHPVYVAFEDTFKIDETFVLDLSNFHYTGEDYKFNPSGMFYGCPAGEIVGLNFLPVFDTYSLIFYNLPNIKYLKVSELNCYSYHNRAKGLDFNEDTQKFCCSCPSLESLDMSYLSFSGSGYKFLPAIFQDKGLLCGDWDVEEKRLGEIYSHYNGGEILRSEYIIKNNFDHTKPIVTFIESQLWDNDNLKHVNLFGASGELYTILMALSRASRRDKDILNIYIDKENYKTILNYMYIISRHLAFWRDAKDWKSGSIGEHWRSIRVIQVNNVSEWEEYRSGNKDISKSGKVFNFHYYDYFQSDKNKCLEEVRRLLEEGKSDADILKELTKRYSNVSILNALGNMGRGTSISLSYCKRFILPVIDRTVGLRKDSESKLSIGEVAELLYKKYPRTLVNEAIVLYLKDQHIVLGT